MDYDSDSPFSSFPPPGQRGGGFQSLPEEQEQPRRSGRLAGMFRRAPKAKPSKKPSGHTRRILTLNRTLAIVLALIAAALVWGSLGAPEPETTYVLRTAAPIPALSIVSADNLEAVALPDAAIEDGAITGATADEAFAAAETLLSTSRLRTALPAGRQLHTDDFTADATVAGSLAPGERLVSIRAGVHDAVGGQIRTGDHIDVIGVIDVENNPVANVIAHDLEVVSILPDESQFQSAAQQQVVGGDIDKTPSELLPGDPIPGIYVVKADVTQAVILGMANDKATLYLVLRGGDAIDQEPGSVSLNDVIVGTPDTTTGSDGDIPAGSTQADAGAEG